MGVVLIFAWMFADFLCSPISNSASGSGDGVASALSRQSIPAPSEDSWKETRSSVKNTWRELESELTAKAPGNLELLRGPAELDKIKEFEERFGFELPADLKASLLVHNGATEHFCVFHLLSIEDIFKNYCEGAFDVVDYGGWLSHEEGAWEPGALTVGLKNWNLIVDVETGKALLLNRGNCSLEHSDSFESYLDGLIGRIQSDQFVLYGPRSRCLEMYDFGR